MSSGWIGTAVNKTDTLAAAHSEDPGPLSKSFAEPVGVVVVKFLDASASHAQRGRDRPHSPPLPARILNNRAPLAVN